MLVALIREEHPSQQGLRLYIRFQLISYGTEKSEKNIHHNKD